MYRMTDPNHDDYVPLMREDDLIIVFTYVNLAAISFYDYSIGQGSLYTYTTDHEAMTITIKRSEQLEAGQLDDFEENFGTSPTAADMDPDGTGDHGLVSFTVTTTYVPQPES